MEIERKFLVKSLPPGWKARSGSPIRQGYFSMRDKDVEIRLRELGSKRCITIKAGRGLVRLEEEIPISRERFEALWPLVRKVSIQKTRYRIPCAGHTLEVDIYQGHHRGLITAEVEFRSLREAKVFHPPAFLGREVTGSRRYINESLARSTLRRFRKKLPWHLNSKRRSLSAER